MFVGLVLRYIIPVRGEGGSWMGQEEEVKREMMAAQASALIPWGSGAEQTLPEVVLSRN